MGFSRRKHMKISLTLFPQKIHSRIFLGIKKIFSRLNENNEKIKPLFKNSKFTIREGIHLPPGDYELTGWYNCKELDDDDDLGSVNFTIEPKKSEGSGSFANNPQEGIKPQSAPTDDYDDFFDKE